MQDQIRQTLGQRIVQEERLIALDRILRALNAYYAFFTAATAVLSAVYPTDSWRVLLAVMAVLMSMTALIQSLNRSHERLSLIQRDRAELERILCVEDESEARRQLQPIITMGANAGAQERRGYERVMDRTEKRQAIVEGRPAGMKILFGYEKFLYWFIEIAALVCLTLAALLPVAGVVLAACGLL